MTRFTFFAAALAVGAALATIQPTLAQSASSTTPPAREQAPGATAGPARGMGMPGAQMMGMHEQMMADMTTMDVKLDALITKMNATEGAAKVDAMAEALTALVSQHRTMRDGMMQMHGQTMMQMHGPAAMPMGAR